MRTFKVIAPALMALALFVSCTSTPEATVPQDQYDQLKEKYQELQKSQETLRDSYADQASEMEKIFQDLSKISGKTSALRLDVESGTAKITQAEQIQTNIDAIKQRIANLQKLGNEKDKKYAAMLEELNGLIAQKEEEIENLKNEIASRDNTIKTQQGTIEEQLNTISRQESALEQKVAEQAKSLYQAGADFEELADNAPEVTRNKNKAKIDEWALSMYKKAFNYYSAAEIAGYAPASLKLEQVEAKISAIEHPSK